MESPALQSIHQAHSPATTALYHHPSLGLILMDSDYRYTMVNPLAEEYLGISAEALLGQNHFDVFPQARHHDVFETLVDSHWVTYTQHRPHASAFDEVDCWEVSIALHHDSQGQQNGYLMLIQRASSFRRAMQEAERQRQALYALLESAPAGIVIAQGDDGRVLMMNAAAQHIFGETLVPGSHISTVNPDCSLLLAIRTGERIEGGQLPFTTAGGRSITVLLDCAPLGMWNDEPTAIAVIHDISGYVEHERELETQNRWLREVDQAKDNFLANVSHELKTPLTAILGWVSLAREVATSEVITQALEVVERSARRQAWMIEDLLTLSNCLADRMKLLPKRARMTEVCAEAVARAYRALPDRPMPIEVCVSDEVVCMLDAQRMSHAIGNLLSNALKFTKPDDAVSLRVEEEGPWIRIIVSDTGIGIAEDDITSLFHPFWQSDSSLTRKYSGAGIGLSVVKELVTSHGGEVWAESAGRDHGSRFTILLAKDGPPKQ